MTLPELIAALEKADGPDRELDFWCWWYGGSTEAHKPLPSIPPSDYVAAHRYTVGFYTASIDAGLRLIPKGWTRVVDASAPDLGIDVELFAPGNGLRIKGTHDDEPVATCIVALKARLS